MNTGDWLSFIEHQFVNGACPLFTDNVCDSIPGDEEYDTYLDDSEYEKCPEY